MSATALKLQMALRYHNAGELAKAGALYEAILEGEPDHPDALHLLGVVAYQKAEPARALALIERALAGRPDDPEFLNHRGLAAAALGRYDEAMTDYRRALAVDPRHESALVNLGSACQVQGRHEEAIGLFRRALDRVGAPAGLHRQLGISFMALDRHQEAAAAFRSAVDADPADVPAWINLGSARFALGDVEGAVACCRKALELAPDSVDALVNLGLALRNLGGDGRAREALERAVALDASLPAAYRALGDIDQERGRIDDARRAYARGLEVAPDDYATLVALGNLCLAEGRGEEARALFRRALPNRPDDTLRIKLATMLQPVYPSKEAMRADRARAEADVAALGHERLTIRDPFAEAAVTNFYSAYQGFNDRPLQTATAGLFARACPDLLYIAPHCRDPRPVRDRPVRVGFISAKFGESSITRYMQGFVEHLDRERMTVSILCFARSKAELAPAMVRSADAVVLLGHDYRAARERIAEQALDIIVYPDIGMEHRTYFMGFARLAPVQCVTWGHPSTTGIANIDCFLSADEAEVPEAQDHYSERLVRLPGLTTYYYRPSLAEPLRTRWALGLPAAANLYCYPHSLFKLHPDFDSIIAAILRADPRGRVILFRGAYDHRVAVLRERLARAMPDVIERIDFIPQQRFDDYLAIVAVSDVVLDSHPFGGGNTTYQAFAVATPLVTLPSRFLAGRTAQMLYRRIGFTDLIADSPEDYAAVAVRVAADRDYRAYASDRMRAGADLVFEDMGTVRAWESFLIHAAVMGTARSIRAWRPG